MKSFVPFLAILSFVSLPGIAWAFEPMFDTPLSYWTGSWPSSVCTGDLNGDGCSDLVVANDNSDNISVLFGDGNGTFAPAADYATGGNPKSVCCADLDGDKNLDIMTANFDSNNISVLMNNGDGTFTDAVNYSAGVMADGVGTYSVCSGDLDGDGDMDLAATSILSNDISIFINKDDGTFAAAVIYEAGNHSRSICRGDFDGDGDTDLAVVNEYSNDVSVFLGEGDGTFAGAVNCYSCYPVGISCGDPNGDGIEDLVVTNWTVDDITIFAGNGDGTFAAATTHASRESRIATGST